MKATNFRFLILDSNPLPVPITPTINLVFRVARIYSENEISTEVFHESPAHRRHHYR
jgi:hypothetical protein